MPVKIFRHSTFLRRKTLTNFLIYFMVTGIVKFIYLAPVLILHIVLRRSDILCRFHFSYYPFLPSLPLLFKISVSSFLFHVLKIDVLLWINYTRFFKKPLVQINRNQITV